MEDLEKIDNILNNFFFFTELKKKIIYKKINLFFIFHSLILNKYPTISLIPSLVGSTGLCGVA